MSRERQSSARRPDRRERRRGVRPLTEGLEARELLATFLVTSDQDNGPGTLRDAISQANGTPAPDTITFSIGGSGGVQTIRLNSALPKITAPIVIDGQSQPGYDPGTPRPLIELNGATAGAGATGLDFDAAAAGSTVRALSITQFSGDGIQLRGDNYLIAGNFIGVGPAGNVALGNGDVGLEIQSSRGNTIGGTTAPDRNVISGNASHGIRFNALFASDASGNRVVGNYIGTDVTGAVAVANGGHGIDFFGGGSNTIGGTAPGSGNVISGNSRAGIDFFGPASSRNLVVGNLIGTDATGSRALGNVREGIFGLNNANTIGGTTPSARNVISSNGAGGLSFQDQLDENGVPIGSVIQGNFIGTDISGTIALGNIGFGVRLFGDEYTVGGSEAGAGNLIANTRPDVFQKAAGVTIILGSKNNSILSNSIRDNGRLGIDFNDDGEVLANDPLDADTSFDDGLSNEGQNYPVIEEVESGGGVTIIRGTLNSTPLQSFNLQFFLNTAADPSGFGEGQTFLRQATAGTDAAGNAPFEIVLDQELADGLFVTATATDGAGNTSEFSGAVAIEALPAADLALSVTTSPDPVQVGTELEYQISVRNDGPAAATDVRVRVPLPLGSQFASASGGATPDPNGVVVFDFPSIALNTSATATLRVLPTVVGPATTSVTVESGTIDPAPANNRLDVTASVVPGTDQSVFNFSAASYNAAETDGVATITVSRTNGTGAVSVRYAATAGTATAPNDFTAVSGTLNFAAGEQVKTFDVPLVNDFLVEGNETANLALSEPTGGSVLGVPFGAQLVILDDDPTPPSAGRFRLGAPTFAVVEGARVINVPVERIGGATGDVSVRIRTTDGTATGGADFQAQDFVIPFSPGDDAPKFVLIPITDDAADEPDETFNVLLSEPTGGAALGGPSTAVVAIADDDATPPPPEFQTVQLSSASFSVAENALNALVTVTRSAGVGTVVATLSTSDGTARANVKYTPVAAQLTFAPGELSKVVEIPILNTNVFEGDQTVNLTLTLPQGGTRLGSPSTAVLTIIDDEAAPIPPPRRPGVFNFTTARFLVLETESVATITVLRSDGDAGATTVQFTTRSGTATPGADYTSVTQTLSFADGETTKVVTVPILDDLLVEGDEAVGLFLESPTGGAGLGPIASSVLTIAENDLDRTAPSVVDARLIGSNAAITALSFTFSEEMDPAAANNPANFQLVALGRDGRPGTRDDRPIGVLSAAYDASTRTVTVTPAAPLAQGQTYSLALLADGPGQLADAAGNLLDGNGDGIAGGSYAVTASRAPRHTYVDSNNDQVQVRLNGGGVLDLLRNASGEAVEVRVVNPRANRSVLNGAVRRRRGGDGVTTIGRLVGIDGFGVVRSRLTTPPFLIASVSADGVDALLAGRRPRR